MPTLTILYQYLDPSFNSAMIIMRSCVVLGMRVAWMTLLVTGRGGELIEETNEFFFAPHEVDETIVIDFRLAVPGINPDDMQRYYGLHHQSAIRFRAEPVDRDYLSSLMKAIMKILELILHVVVKHLCTVIKLLQYD